MVFAQQQNIYLSGFIYIYRSIDKQQSLFQLITINYNNMCVGERDIVNGLLILPILKFIVHAILLLQVHP